MIPSMICAAKFVGWAAVGATGGISACLMAVPLVIGGYRSYITDFEVYDERAADHQNIVLDLYIGITP